MVKLFAMEDGDDKDHLENNELLIDKVLKFSQQDNKSPMSLTADILKQRQELKKDINKQLNAPPEDTNDDDDSSGNNDNSNNDDTSGDGNGDSGDDGKNTSQDQDGDKGNKTDGDAADDKDSLNSLVGSGLNDDGNSDDKKSDGGNDDKGEPATESRSIYTAMSRIFTPLKQHYAHYSAALETFNLGGKKLAMEEQPIVYVKDAIIESLKNHVNHANTNNSNNKAFVEKNSVGVKDINEKISIFRQFVEEEKFHFTSNLISDKDILGNVACPEKSDLTETARILLNYVDDSTKANTLVINNKFGEMSSAYMNQNFHVEDNDLVYKTVLPGFNIVRLHLDQYRDYMKTDIQEYQYYKLKVLKTEDLYNLSAISITEDRDLNRLLDLVDKLIVNISLTTDNLNDINGHFTKFIDDIKIVIFDP